MRQISKCLTEYLDQRPSFELEQLVFYMSIHHELLTITTVYLGLPDAAALDSGCFRFGH